MNEQEKAEVLSLLNRHTVAVTETGCEIWMGTVNKSGYGLSEFGPAHRASYAARAGKIPTGLVLDHLCRVRCCVNPRHLEPVTHQENIRRGFASRRDPSAPVFPRDESIKQIMVPRAHHRGLKIWAIQNGCTIQVAMELAIANLTAKSLPTKRAA